MLARYDDAGSLTFETKEKVELGPCGLAEQRRPGVPAAVLQVSDSDTKLLWELGKWGAFARTFPDASLIRASIFAD
jgi:hypothetical protein